MLTWFALKKKRRDSRSDPAQQLVVRYRVAAR